MEHEQSQTGRRAASLAGESLGGRLENTPTGTIARNTGFRGWAWSARDCRQTEQLSPGLQAPTFPWNPTR